MSWHPKEDRRLERLSRFSDATGDKYCWAHLAYLGMAKYEGHEIEDAKDACRRGESCKEDSVKNGSCWCCKFVDGKLNITETEVAE